jgi:hypothetical protein
VPVKATVLGLAAFNINRDIVEYLIANGGDIDEAIEYLDSRASYYKSSAKYYTLSPRYSIGASMLREISALAGRAKQP